MALVCVKNGGWQGVQYGGNAPAFKYNYLEFKGGMSAVNRSALLRGAHEVLDGQEALDFLAHKAPFEDSVVPDLILLDLNRPGMDGAKYRGSLIGQSFRPK